MGILSGVAVESVVKDVVKMIDSLISENKEDEKVVNILTDLGREVLNLLPYRLPETQSVMLSESEIKPRREEEKKRIEEIKRKTLQRRGGTIPGRY